MYRSAWECGEGLIGWEEDVICFLYMFFWKSCTYNGYYEVHTYIKKMRIDMTMPL